MKLLDNRNITDPAVNLALEEFVVRNLNPDENGFVLLYENEPSVIMGKHQNPLLEINLPYISANGIKITRRISGGGTVYHDMGNLNFSFITKFDPKKIHNFSEFTKPITVLLKKLGVESQLDERSNILINEKKISGNAQFSNTRHMISHGTILYNSNLETLSNSLKAEHENYIRKTLAVRSIRSTVTNVKESLKASMSYEEFKQALSKEIFGNRDIEKIELEDKQWDQVYQLAKEKYSNWEWVFGRTPPFIYRKNGAIDLEFNVKNFLIEFMSINQMGLSENIKKSLMESLTGKQFLSEEIKDLIKRDTYSSEINEALDSIFF